MAEKFTDCVLIDQISNVLSEKGYKFFENGDYNLNIIGVRGPQRQAGLFDDTLLVVYKQDGDWQIRWYWITTDAGTYWLENPMNQAGTALLKEGQYRSSWVLGKHKGEYDALVQCKPVTVYRDNNKDRIIDLEGSPEQTGQFGINIHRSNPHRTSEFVERWSAGCQVFANPNDYSNFMELVMKSASIFGPHFTYTLCRESDFVDGDWRSVQA